MASFNYMTIRKCRWIIRSVFGLTILNGLIPEDTGLVMMIALYSHGYSFDEFNILLVSKLRLTWGQVKLKNLTLKMKFSQQGHASTDSSAKGCDGFWAFIWRTASRTMVNHWGVAQRSAVSVSAIRFYEEKDLIWSTRTQGISDATHGRCWGALRLLKLHSRSGLAYNKFMMHLLYCQGIKLRVNQIGKLCHSTGKCSDQQIMNLLKLRQQLDQCIGCGCLSLDQCPLRNPDDQLGKESAGAHFQEVLMNLLKAPD